MTCEHCDIVKPTVEGAPDCPTPSCADSSGNYAYLFLMMFTVTRSRSNETVAVAMEEEDHEGEEHEGEAKYMKAKNTKAKEHEGEEHEGRDEATVEGKPYGAVIGATLLVNVATLSGLVLVIFTSIHRRCHKRGRDGDGATSALFGIARGARVDQGGGEHDEEGHMEEEEGHRRSLQGADGAEHEERVGEEEGEKSESVAAAQFGCAFIGGSLLPLLFAVLFHVDDPDGCLEEGDIGTAAVDVGAEVCSVTERRHNQPRRRNDDERVVLIAAIVLGYSMHNLADGMFIAASFQGCDPALALTIVSVTNSRISSSSPVTGGCRFVNALVLNFASGLSVVLGGVLFLALNPSRRIGGHNNPRDRGGRTLPRNETIVKTRRDRIWTLFGVKFSERFPSAWSF
ncbi:hypothetical protein ACHAW5_000951 [Stephanodiscus triporus]|uniref:Uncharacterized protein n=1 Tax=Stephanodiscus triporus TaxID=2934178 RepID=A0ABD3NFM3_9STRA